jgi:ATP-dependent Clp protease adaptor protein ClpS
MLSPEIEKTLETQQEATEGPQYQVIVHNDDVTPMEFVIATLINIFKLNGPQAYQVMLTAHYHGSAYVQTLPKPEAVKRIGMAHTSASLHGYPLHFTMQPAGKPKSGRPGARG